MFVFAKVMPKTLLVPFFSGHGVVYLSHDLATRLAVAGGKLYVFLHYLYLLVGFNPKHL